MIKKTKSNSDIYDKFVNVRENIIFAIYLRITCLTYSRFLLMK